MLEEIMKRKPKGATHYIDNGRIYYYRLDEFGFVEMYNNDDEWFELHLHVSETTLKPL